ncbi:MAG: DUF3592 domain-containing protein [Terracidiphilus sp.]|jgi:hypothetical protein
MDSNFSVAEASIIPSELTGRLPRRTRIEKPMQWAVIVTILLGIAVAIFLWAGRFAVQLMQTRTALRHESSETTGVVEELLKTRVKYSFVVNGRSFTGSASRPGLKLRESDPLTIRYLPSNPAVNHPAAWEEPIDAAWFPFLIPTVLVLTLMGLMFNMRSIRRLLVEGRPAVAVVTKRSRGARGGVYVVYEFRTEDGRVMTGTWGESPEEIGANLCVLYLPQNPRRNMRYPSSDYRVVQ